MNRLVPRLLVLTLLTASHAHAQQASQEPITTLHVSAQQVLVDASVSAKNSGQPIENLKPEDFVLTEDGVPQQITYLSQDRLPLSLVLMFDLTDSVRPQLKALASGATEVLAHLKPEDEVAVMGFSSRVIPMQAFTTDRSLATAAVTKAADTQETEGTFIHEDMFEAIDEAGKATIPNSRRVLVWLTDGSANRQNHFTQKVMGQNSPAYLHTKEEATDRLTHSNVVTAALIEHSASGDATLAMAFMVGGAQMGDVQRYADLTGGPVLKSSKQEVAARLAALIDELRRRETLGYKPNASKPAGTYCKLKLELSPAFFRKHPEIKKGDVVIRTRPDYYR